MIRTSQQPLFAGSGRPGRNHPCALALLSALVFALSPGCAGLHPFSEALTSWNSSHTQAAGIRRILTMWTVSSREEANGLSSTGFMGKVLFFGVNDESSMEVEGRIETIIYEWNNDEWTLKRRFLPTQKAWKSHQRSTALGIVYDLFVPHDVEPGRQYALVMEHESLDGVRVSSQPTRVP